MAVYKNILLAVDLQPAHDDAAIQRALELANEDKAALFIVHAVEEIHAYGATQGYDIIMNLEEKLIDEAGKLLNEVSRKMGIAAERQILARGKPTVVILEQAKTLKADLIIVGSYGRHGLSALLGSTTDGIIHSAPCDVLAVKVEEGKK